MFLALFLVALNGFFVAAEFSLVKLRHTQAQEIQRLGGIRSRILFIVHQNLDSYLSACQLGITIASLGLGWIGEPAFAALIKPIFMTLGIFSKETHHFLSLLVAFSIITFLHIVVGELMPKSMALRQPGKMSLLTAFPLFIFYKGLYPAILLLNLSTNNLLKIFKLDKIAHTDHAISTEELKLIFKLSHTYGDLSHSELGILNKLIELYDLNAYEVMRPAEELVALNINKPFSENFRIITKHRFSRYPVYEERVSNIIGILHIKDILSIAYSSKKNVDLRKLLRPIMKATFDTPSLELLDDFRRGMSHLALVYNNNELAGFVTFDHLMQVLLGRIKDEFHITEEDWIDLPDGTYLIKGAASLYSLEHLLKIDLSAYPAHTVLGLVMFHTKVLPHVGVKIRMDQFTIAVEKKSTPRDTWFRIYPKL